MPWVMLKVAIRKEGTYMEPEKFVIQTSAWDEYDPAFFHMTVQVGYQKSWIRRWPQ